jgi:hypothetical protein
MPAGMPDVALQATGLAVAARDNNGNSNRQTVATQAQLQYAQEIEPNDSIAGATQVVAKGSTIEGTIQSGDPGQIFGATPGPFATQFGQRTIQDFYQVICCDPPIAVHLPGYGLNFSVDFTLDAAATPATNIDLFLFDAAGALIRSSTHSVPAFGGYGESIHISAAPGDSPFTAAHLGQAFYIGIQALDVPNRVRYRVRRD